MAVAGDPVREGGTGLDPSTVAVHAGRPARTPGAPLNVPVSLTSTFVSGGERIYGRDANETWEAFEDVLGALEGGTARAFATGMAAVAAVLETLPAGAVVVAPADAYNGVRRFLADAASKGRLSVRLVDVTDTAAAIEACQGADLLWAESPTNPLLGIADIEALAEGAHRCGAVLAVDNTFATPVLQRPLDLGADLVVHSVSKLLGGHSDLVMGAVVARDEERVVELDRRRSLHGAAAGPLECFLALRGVRTLPVRLERAQATAGQLAERLEGHPHVDVVRYPSLASHPGRDLAARQMRGPGTMVAFDVAGGAEAAEAFCAAVQVAVHATSLGGVETIVERRGRYEGERHLPPGLIRMSVGLEHPDDLWDDLDSALRLAP